MRTGFSDQSHFSNYFNRFVVGFAVLFLVCPRRMKEVSRRQEFTFMLAGLCGICMYYLLENSALTYTLASNVGVIISVAPFFTAVLINKMCSSGVAFTYARRYTIFEKKEERRHRR